MNTKNAEFNLHQIAPVPVAGIPSELQGADVFINWKYLPGNGGSGGLLKCPIDKAGCKTGYNNSAIHKPLAEAVGAQKAHPDRGVGISLLKAGLRAQSGAESVDEPEPGWLWVLDLDGFVEFGGEAIDNEVRPIYERVASYAALSVSTTGAQVFFVSDKPPATIPKIKFKPSEFAGQYPDIGKYQNRAIEIFSKGRFIALTGLLLFEGRIKPMRFIPAAEVDEILEGLNTMALDGGGQGWAVGGGAKSKGAKGDISAEATTTPHHYATLTPASLALVLKHTDYEDEKVWWNTALALARAYGETGRDYYQAYSRGDYAGGEYAGFDVDEVNAKFNRALDELHTTPDGLGMKHLVEAAIGHKDWPQGVAVEYDDALMSGGSKGVKDMLGLFGGATDEEQGGDGARSAAPPEQKETGDRIAGESSVADPAIAKLNEEWFVSVEGGRARIFHETVNAEMGTLALEAHATHDFRTLFANRNVSVKGPRGKLQSIGLADHWIKSPQRRQYTGGLALLPGKNAPSGVYNLWRGWGVEPVAGNVKPALRHLYRVVCKCDKASYQYLIRWMARAVQYPAEPAEVAVVMRGGRGVGKGTGCRWLLAIFGAHGMQITQSRHLVGNFNAHLRTTCFLFADEAFFAGDKAGEGVLKGLITEKELVIERKGVDAFTARNRLKIMMASNSDWVVPAGVDERRFLVLDVSDEQKQNHDYFKGLNEHMDAGGLSALLHYLLTFDISKFNIRSVPNTAGLDQQKLLSLPPLKAWLYECLYTGGLVGVSNEWPTEVSRGSVTSSFESFVQKRRLTYVDTGRAVVGRELRKAFPTLREAHPRAGPANKRERTWVFPPLAECRNQFTKALGLGRVSWPDSDDAEEAVGVSGGGEP